MENYLKLNIEITASNVLFYMNSNPDTHTYTKYFYFHFLNKSKVEYVYLGIANIYFKVWFKYKKVQSR